MIKDYSQLEQTSFRTFLAFSLLNLVFLIPSLFIFSQSYRVKDIEVQGSLTINEYNFSQFYDTSIWAIGESSFENIYTLDKTIEKIELTKELPNKLSITISHYLQVAKITDLRGSVPTEKVLYKNLSVAQTIFIKVPVLIVRNEDKEKKQSINMHVNRSHAQYIMDLLLDGTKKIDF